MSARQRSYIVFGETGQYDDHQAWPVVTYSVAAAAEEHCAKATEWAQEHGWTGTDYRRSVFSHSKGNPWDPHMRADFNGVSYYVASVPSRISSVREVRDA